MGSSFTRETLPLDARIHRWYPKGGRWLLWPAWRWRVHTPQVVERPLDVFGRAALGMCAAGVTQPDQIVRYLHLPADLWAEVLRALRQQRCLDRGNQVTKLGVQLLEQSQRIDTTTVVGYVFRDPYSGELWPRVRVAPGHTDAEYRTRWPYVQLGFGTIGESEFRSFRALCVLPDPGRPLPSITRPPAEEVIWAAASDRQAASMGDADWDDVEMEEGFAADDDGDVTSGRPSTQPLPLERVQLITDAEPVLLVTCLFLPKSPIDASNWQVMDPFDGRASHRLRLLVEQECAHNDRLHELLDDLTETLRSDARNAFVVGDAQLGREAVELVDARIPAALRHDSRLREFLIDMQQALLAANALGDAGASKRNMVLLEAGKALERVFATLLREHPPSPAAAHIAKKHTPGSLSLAELRDRSAEAVGLQQPLPRGLTGPSKLDGLAKVLAGTWNGSLRDRLLAVLVAAGEDPQASHPLRVAARNHPDLYERIDRIVERRNAPAHDTARPLPTQADAEAAVVTVFSVMRACFDPDHVTTGRG